MAEASNAVRLMPEGKEDMETIPPKKRKVNPAIEKKFCRTTPLIKATSQILGGLIRNYDKAIQMTTVVRDCFSYCSAGLGDSSSLNFQLGQNIMSRLVNFLKRWLSASAIDPDDHLMGALDLSDTAYCAELLARHRAQ